MASAFPILFGPPSFGDEDRDQWIRVLTLFLQDPFVGMASKIGNGAVTVNNGWQVPAGNITGLDLTFKNNFGIRELNPFSEATTLANAEVRTISDRPGVLFIFSEDGSGCAVFGLATNFTRLWLTDGYTIWGNTAGVADINVYYDAGDDDWKIENNSGATASVYMLISSMGAQR